MYNPFNAPVGFWKVQDLCSSPIAPDSLSFSAGFTTSGQVLDVTLDSKLPILVVMGKSESGKSSFLDLCLFQLMAKYSPFEMSIIAHDACGTRFSRMFRNHGVPHLLNRKCLELTGRDFCNDTLARINNVECPVVLVIDDVDQVPFTELLEGV